MKTYIYKYLSNITTNYHSGGGLLIVTDIDPQDEWNNYVDVNNYSVDAWETNFNKFILPEPDMVYECSATEKAVFVFEDAGCC